PACSESLRSESRATRRCSRMNSPRSCIRSSRSFMLLTVRELSRAPVIGPTSTNEGSGGEEAFAEGDEDVGDLGVELRPTHAGDLVGGVVEREGSPVGAVGGHG